MLQSALSSDPGGRLSGARGDCQEMRKKDWGELLLPGEEPRRGCCSTETHYFSSQLAVGEFSHLLFFLSFSASPFYFIFLFPPKVT